MTDRRLRYSERKRLAETGSLGDFVHDEVPAAFRNALWYVIHHPGTRHAQKDMIEKLHQEARPYFGWQGSETTTTFIATADTESLLDFIEILIELCTTRSFRGEWDKTTRSYYSAKVLTDVEDRVNELCERHRFGYRFERGEARKVGSPALEAEVVGPALLAARRPGWDQVERSYREALAHQRGGETDDALTAAHASVEAALKAVGMTGQYSTMAKQFRKSSLVPSYLRQAPDALEALLTLLARSNAIRSAEGDAHGKAPGSVEAPQALADLAVHWAGAFIVYLAEVTRD